MMTWAIRVLAMIVFATIAFGEAEACSCGVGRGPACQEAWRESVDSVLLVRVDKIEASQGKVGTPRGAMGITVGGGLLRVTVAVEESYRGASAKTVELYTAASSAACGFAFQQGERYLIYAWMTKDAQLMVDLCSSTRPAKYAEEDISYPRSVPSLPPTAAISGSVWRYTHDPNFKPKFQPSLMDHYRPPEQEYMAMVPVPGVTVVAKAKDGTQHQAVVDSAGDWRIADLAPGAYTVLPQTDGTTFVYPFRASIEVAPRGCAKVDIRVESNGRISGTLEHHSPESDWAFVKVFVLQFPNPVLNHPVREMDLELGDSAFEMGPLPPGKYILGAYVVKKIGTPDRFTFADWGWTYFPGVSDMNIAQPIEVAEGKAVTNVKLKMMY
jgi:hypothetical protein